MIWIGLTGGLATGKSKVSSILRQKGYAVLDADDLARQALGPGSEIESEVLARYGSTVLNSQGQLDRKKVGQIVFKNKSELNWLESRIHPWIQNRLNELKKELELKNTPVAFYDIPLLFEKSKKDEFDFVIVVSADEVTQIERAMKRDGLTKDQVLDRMKNQISVQDKVSQAHHVVDNSGDLLQLDAQIVKLENWLSVLKK